MKLRNILKYFLFFLPLLFACNSNTKTKYEAIYPGEILKDDRGMHVNAHGAGILYYEGKYFLFGEHKGERSSAAWVGVTCYSSTDFYNWKYEGVALPVVKDDPKSDIVEGSVIERPKVIYNERTKQFVMYFHLELKGKGYSAARVGVAVSDQVTGPYTFLKSYRPCAGHWPVNITDEQKKITTKIEDFPDWWTEDWRSAVEDGMFIRRDFDGGQMSRDMTLFVDDDGVAYHIYSSEENLTIHLAELSDDYLSHTGKYITIAPGGHNEAPSIFKNKGKYFMITSGCTGWATNAARLFTADAIWGPWEQHPNPCIGDDAELTFHSQSTFIQPVIGKKDAFIFMGDRWTPKNPIDARYIWLPIQFKKGMPILKWMDKWDLNVFDDLNADSNPEKTILGYKLVWSDEFNYDGMPDPKVWSNEEGYVRNEELQWYQSQNAYCYNGVLCIEGKEEQILNPNFKRGSNNWKTNREFAQYTSSSLKTENKKEFQYGRFEIRAKIPTASGSWPAIWTMGKNMPWPSNGEIDIMEYYPINDVPNLLANTAWGGDIPGQAIWDSATIPLSELKEQYPYWADKFHIWRMDWDEQAIRLYIDDILINETLLKDARNGSVGKYSNPFQQPHYILLNLAIGGKNGGIPDNSAFPLSYEIDYVRVYQEQ